VLQGSAGASLSYRWLFHEGMHAEEVSVLQHTTKVSTAQASVILIAPALGFHAQHA
jgi:hypothetical protein